MKKLLALVLAVLMVVSLFAACDKNKNTTGSTNGDNTTDSTNGRGDVAAPTYTYNTYMSALGDCWNPHTWEDSADSTMMSYLEAPLTDLTIKDSTTGEYQWIFVAATDIQDVTAEHQDDLVKYGCAETEATEGYVYEISLRPEMKWEDGTPINADTYIYSMKALLDPTMRNYRAGTFTDGDGALAGAAAYFNGGAPIYSVVIDYPDGENPVQVVDPTTVDLYMNLTATNMTMAGYSFYDFISTYNFVDKTLYETLNKEANAYGYIKMTEENQDNMITIMDQYLSAFGMTIYFYETDEEGNLVLDEEENPIIAGVNWDFVYEFMFYFTETYGEVFEYDPTVGLYKVDEYTIRYVCAVSYDYYYFLTSMASNWLVYEDLYEAGKETTGELTTTNYATSKETSMSYGAYKIGSLQDNKQVVYVQNENYWEYTKNSDGTLSSVTFFEVDGEYRPQYQIQNIVIDVMTPDAAKLAFLAGELDDWAPTADDLKNYYTSEQLYQVDETYTSRLFFHTNLTSLQAMDEAGNVNSVVLSNDTFRKAFSLAINRADWVSATSGYKPAYSLLNSLYFYDVYEDPSSVYRNTDEAMQAICNLYGVEYGEGTPYATLKDAYKSINGYNLTEAKALFTQACAELVEAGLYTAGDPITIQIAYSAGALTSSAQQQVALLQGYINAAFEGTGFGTFTLTAVDNLSNRYQAVADGQYAIGFGAWGGAAFYPFNAIGCYTDADYAGTIHEMGCWDPAATNLTLTINGEEITMTYTEWSRSIKGTGIYAQAEAEVKLAILAGLEENILNKYYCIPLASMASASLLSYKVNYYTEDYNFMYGFGGLRLMSFNFTDAEWAEYVESEGGQLTY